MGVDTKYLNVSRLETVRIDVGGKSITWKFERSESRRSRSPRLSLGLRALRFTWPKTRPAKKADR